MNIHAMMVEMAEGVAGANALAAIDAGAALDAMTVRHTPDELRMALDAMTVRPLDDEVRAALDSRMAAGAAGETLRSLDAIGDAVRAASMPALAAADYGITAEIQRLSAGFLPAGGGAVMADVVARAPLAAAELTPPKPVAARAVVTIYVRLNGDDRDQRVLTFKIPEGLDPMDLLDAGFAIDGNQAAGSVHPTADDGDPFDGPLATGRTLVDALRNNQVAAVAFLRDRGFAARFA
jgi:plasmid stability protein